MDDELKQYLVAMETRLEAKIANLDARMAEMRTRLEAKVEKAQKTLAIEFHKSGPPESAPTRTDAVSRQSISK